MAAAQRGNLRRWQRVWSAVGPVQSSPVTHKGERGRSLHSRHDRHTIHMRSLLRTSFASSPVVRRQMLVSATCRVFLSSLYRLHTTYSVFGPRSYDDWCRAAIGAFSIITSSASLRLVGLGLDLVVVLGVLLLVDVVVGLVEVGLVADTLGRSRLGELVDRVDLLVGEGNDCNVS